MSADGHPHPGGARHTPPRPGRHICGATAVLPLRTLVLVLDLVPGRPAHPFEVVTGLRCALEAHTEGPHHDLVRELADARRGEVWTWWEEGGEAEAVAVLPDCSALAGAGGPADDACVLFAGHPGGHGFEFRDPEYEAVLESPEYRALLAETERRLRGRGGGPG
jgi:hypothetical protein